MVAMRPRLPCIALLAVLAGCATSPQPPPPRVGVVFLFHGGADRHSAETSWNATMQIFAYDPNSTVYRRVIWNPRAWPMLLDFGNAPKELGKYAFEHARIGGPDPANTLTRERWRQLRTRLEAREAELGVDFVVDYASWLSLDPAHHVYPRSLYQPGVPGGQPLSYCGSERDGGPWPGCVPDRYDTDGTVERLLAQGVEEILFIDLTTGGVRFFKSFDAVNLARQVVARHNAATGDDVAVWWLNDPADLMTRSYPAEPAGWTRSLGRPLVDRHVPLDEAPNPVAADPRLAAAHARGILAEFRPEVAPERTGVLLVNHATRDHNQYFDPKIDDTLLLNRNIRAELLAAQPGLDPANIVGAWFGRKELNPLIGKPERTRRMRGENLGEAWLYETDRQMPGGEAGYRYWEALAYLKDRGVEHIVVAFPQIMVDSALNLVEVPNQIGKEIGYRTWRYFEQGDFATYPEAGHPFADYWGVWVKKECPLPDGGGRVGPCCFEMGGCADGRPYPPPRLTPLDEPRDDLDPSLAFDVSAYGHLGYDPELGPPDDARPVQAQYRGSWSLWRPPNSDPAIADMLADHVLRFLRTPRPAESPPPVWLDPAAPGP